MHNILNTFSIGTQKPALRSHTSDSNMAVRIHWHHSTCNNTPHNKILYNILILNILF